MKRISISDHKRVSEIAEIASYGLEWAKNDEDTHDGHLYQTAGVEAVAHQISCCLYQWFHIEDWGTSDVVELFKLDEFPSRQKIERKIINIIQSKSK